MTRRNEPAEAAEPPRKRYVLDRRHMTYSTTFDNPFQRNLIRVMEWMTGRLTIFRRGRKFENESPPVGQAFWDKAMEIMGIDLQTPQAEIENIPAEGPVVLVANHPHGLVDGMILAALVGRRRQDYRILTRSLLTDINETAASHMIAVPFPHEENAQRKMIEMRAKAMDHLAQGGLVALFPSGVVATSETMFGPVVEAEWNVFTAKMIRRSGAQVVPLLFPGENSRAYQIANRLSATIRQGLLIHEVVRSFDKPQKPRIGAPIPQEVIDARITEPRAFMAWLRQHTLNLRHAPDGAPFVDTVTEA